MLDQAPGLQQVGLDWALTSSGVCVPRLLVQAGPILAFGLLEYYRLIKRIIKEIRIFTWTHTHTKKVGESMCQEKK